MVQTRNVAKRQKTEECTSCMESVLYNSDSLFKIASYLPADGLLYLALTCRRFGIAPISDGDGDSIPSLIEETARRIVHDVATEEQKNALPGYDENNWLCKYNYLLLLRAPITFDQLVGIGRIECVEGIKLRVITPGIYSGLATAFSNNIMMAGKHYVSFEANPGETGTYFSEYIGVMRPGKSMQSAKFHPLSAEFYNNFTQREGSVQYNNTVNCCVYDASDGRCYSSNWGEDAFIREAWDGMERFPGSFQIGMFLDLDEGTLTVYKDGRKLGGMKRGLAGHYCWVVSLQGGSQVTIKRGTVPTS